MPAEHALAESLLPFAAVNGNGAWSPPADVHDGVLEIAVPNGLSSRPAIRKEVIIRATSPPVARRSDLGAAGRTRVAWPRKTRPTAATRED
jgi:hypothetical protein